jgi:translocation and assembly module TamB
MGKHLFKLLLISLTLLLYSPVHSEISLTSNTSLDRFDYDLDDMHFTLEKLNASWQFSPFENDKTEKKPLKIQLLKAKRLTITIKSNPEQSSDSPLPSDIRLPFPINIQQADISEVVIIKQEGESQNRYTLNNVQFNFSGDAKTLRLNLMHANTPWGDATAMLNVGTAKPFPLSGNIGLKDSQSNNPFDINTQLTGDFNTLHFESQAWASLQNDKSSLELTSTEPTHAAAKLLINGELNLGDNYLVHAHAQLTELHPDQLGDYPAARINLDLNLNGTLLPNPTATLHIVSKDSDWRNQPIVLSANVQLKDNAIANVDFQIKLADNLMQGNGHLSTDNTQLTWQANLPDLNAIDQHYAGKASFSGNVKGDAHNLLVNFKLAAEQLRVGADLKIGQLNGETTLNLGELSSDPTSAMRKMEGDFKATAIEYDQYSITDAHANLHGTKESHQLLIKAQGQDISLDSLMQGGFSNNNASESMQWQGVLQQFDLSGKTPIKLIAPAALTINKQAITLGKTIVDLRNGRATIEQLHLADNILISKGLLEKVTLNDLPAGLIPLPETLHGSPVFSGKWDINANTALNGNISLWREAGDFTNTKVDGSVLPLGLTEANITLNIKNNQAEISSQLLGENLGDLKLTLATTFTRTATGFTLHQASPLHLKTTANLKTLAWLPMPSALLNAQIEGQLNLSVEGNGTLGAPNLSGNLNGNALSFNLPSEGLTFSQGKLLATFENNQLHIQQATFYNGKDETDVNKNNTGSLSTQGWVRIRQGKPSIDLDWTAEKFTVLSRTDRLLILSGTGKTMLEENTLSVLGKFKIDKGLIELSNEGAPTLGDDVVVLGKTTDNNTPALQVLLNGLEINLGDDFNLRGFGLNAKFTGGLTLNGLTQHHPHAQGTIQVASGTFMAYGQALTIDRGILSFKGTLDNPGLNIRAMRNSKPTNAGVEITGTAFAPVTKLVSDPNVPETEKLSWLVLGRGIDQAGENDFALLSLAAGALLTQGQSIPLQTQLARAAGLDEVSFTGTDAENASLTFGKRLSSQLYLSYAKSVSGLLDVARLTFNLTPRWSLLAEAGTESAVDVLYTFSFK